MNEIEMPKSKVYALADEQGSVTRIEGGYTMGNIADLSEWVYLDEGYGDRYNLCQSHYAEGGLYTMDGIPRYKLVDGVLTLRTEDELAADRAAQPAAPDGGQTAAESAVWDALDAAYREGVNAV